MSDMERTPSTPSDTHANPKRLIAYYILLFFFIFQSVLLLRELGTTHGLQEFAMVRELVDQAFNVWINFYQVLVTVFALLLSFIFILPIAWVYTLTKDEENFDPSLSQTIVVLAMIVTGVMIVISNELACAFSLAGVVAVVRFRNTLQDTKDAVYVFIAVAIGMGCGTHVYHIAVWLSVIMSLTMYLLWKYKFGKSLRAAATSAGSAGGKAGKKEVQRFYEQTSTEARQQLARELEQQIRLMQWADLQAEAEKGKKKANAALIVECNDAYQAIAEVDKALDRYGGRWQLANVSSIGPGHSILEYVGRLPKEVTPAALVSAIQQNGSTSIREISFRSLKGLKNPLALNKAAEKSEEAD
jgi:uncharacterized membrane protein YhiD involved in acid resistance